MAADGKLVVPSEVLRLRWRLWPGTADAEAEADGQSDSGTVRRAAAEVEWVDEVRGGIAAGDCRKALWLRIGGGGGLVDDDGWAAMTGWSLREGRLKCSMGLVEGRGRLELQASFLPKVQCLGLVVRWGPVSGVEAGDDMRFRRQDAI
jgi:hypothetical protein